MDASYPFEPDDVADDQESQPKRPSLRTISLWLIAVAMVFFFLTMYQVSGNLRKSIAVLDAQIKPAQATLTRVNTPAPKVLELQSTLAPLEASIKELDVLKPTLASGRANWPAAMAAIGGFDPAQLLLTSVVQNGAEVVVKGRAASEAAVSTYARSLEAAGVFERVIVQSMRALSTPFAPYTNTPVPAPSATPTVVSSPTPSSTFTPTLPPTGTLTPTIDSRDVYEPDDVQPKDLYLGQTQLHSFFPANDIDQVSFLAKSGRFYRVYTSDLAPGVDTFLVVKVGDTVYVNDDVKPGVLSSEVGFQVPVGVDAQVIVQVRNRGSYGPAMFYRVTAEEYIPTATPAPTATPVPTLTSTAIPSNTPTWTPIPTATLTPSLTRTPVPPSVTPTYTLAPTATATRTLAPTAGLTAAALSGGPAQRVAGLAYSAARGALPAADTSATTVEFVITLVLKAGAP